MDDLNVEIKFRDTSFGAYLAVPDKQKKLPAIILIHEVWGFKEHTKESADRFAAQGYAVLAPDLLSQTGITKLVDQSILKEVRNPATKDEAQKKLRAAMAPIMVPEFGIATVEKLQNCFAYLKQQDFCNGKIAILGFCFGGNYAYALALEQPNLSAAIVFYGHPPQPLDKIQQINCPVLVFTGEQDENLIKVLPQLKETVKKLNKDFTFYEYPNTGHAFFNDTNPVTYVKESAEDAWQKSLEFLAKYL